MRHEVHRHVRGDDNRYDLLDLQEHCKDSAMSRSTDWSSGTLRPVEEREFDCLAVHAFCSFELFPFPLWNVTWRLYLKLDWPVDASVSVFITGLLPQD